MKPEDARAFAVQAHGEQKYGEHPYSYHLDAVGQHHHLHQPVRTSARRSVRAHVPTCAADGANAITSMRYDATELMAGLIVVLCYGTAVTVERDSFHEAQ
jgi:hypothetical protein